MALALLKDEPVAIDISREVFEQRPRQFGVCKAGSNWADLTWDQIRENHKPYGALHRRTEWADRFGRHMQADMRTAGSALTGDMVERAFHAANAVEALRRSSDMIMDRGGMYRSAITLLLDQWKHAGALETVLAEKVLTRSDASTTRYNRLRCLADKIEL